MNWNAVWQWCTDKIKTDVTTMSRAELDQIMLLARVSRHMLATLQAEGSK